MAEDREFVCNECRETFSHGEPVVVAGTPYCSDVCADRAASRSEWITRLFLIGLMILIFLALLIVSDRY